MVGEERQVLVDLWGGGLVFVVGRVLIDVEEAFGLTERAFVYIYGFWDEK